MQSIKIRIFLLFKKEAFIVEVVKTFLLGRKNIDPTKNTLLQQVFRRKI